MYRAGPWKTRCQGFGSKAHHAEFTSKEFAGVLLTKSFPTRTRMSSASSVQFLRVLRGKAFTELRATRCWRLCLDFTQLDGASDAREKDHRGGWSHRRAGRGTGPCDPRRPFGAVRRS